MVVESTPDIKAELGLPDHIYMVGFISPFKSIEDTFPDEINVVIEDLKQEISPNEYFELNKSQLNLIGKNLQIIETNSASLSSIPANEIIYSATIVNPFLNIPFIDHPVIDILNLALNEEVDAKIKQIFVLNNDKAYIITYRAEPDNFDNSASIAQMMMDSFELENIQSNLSTTIPDWIRNNAEWWAQGAIGDNDFVSGIQYLIKEGIIQIPETTSTGDSESQEIPAWIKNNADWWSQGLISDDDFVKGIQYLVEQGIIDV